MSTEPSGLKGPARGGQLATAVTVKGVRYPSITAAAKAYGIDPYVVIRRRAAGWKMLRAVTTPVQRACRAVTVRGQTYRSVSAAAAAFGLSYGVVWTRLHAGWDLERVFTEPRRDKAQAVTVKGQRYRSLTEAAVAFRVNPRLVRYRIRAGWTLERALTPARQSRGAGQAVTVNGVRYVNVSAAALALGHAPSLVHLRLRRWWTIERALSEPRSPKGGCPRKVHFQGRTYGTLGAAAEALGLCARRVHGLVAKHGLSAEEALCRALERERELTQLRERRDAFKAQASESAAEGLEIEFEGVRYASTSALARAYGVRSVTLRSRRRLGWTLAQALGRAAPPKLVREIAAVRVAGEEFASVSAAARHFGVPWSVARYRLQIGATPEQAFGLVPFEARAAQTGKRISVAGERFASITEACRRWKKSPALIQRRIAIGESPEQAFDFEPPPLAYAAVVVGGRPFRFLAAAARHFQVPEERLRALVDKGVDPQVAVEMIRTGARCKNTVRKAPTVTVEGRTFRYVSEAARFFNVDPIRVHGLIARRGISPEEAIRIERIRSFGRVSEELSR